MPPAGRRRFVGALAALVLPAIARSTGTDDASNGADRPIVVATSTPGGGFAQYGATLERVLNVRAGRPLVRARPTRGTAENLALLADGTVDAALIQGTVASELFADGAERGLRILFAMYPSPGMLCVPAAAPVRVLDDVAGKPVVFGVRASGLVTLGRQVFDGIGIDIDRDVDAIYVDEAADAPGIVRSGAAVGLWGAGEGWPGFVRLADTPGGARFVGPTAAQIARIVGKYPLLKPMEVAPGAYRGIDTPLATVGSVNFIVARADLSDDRARRFVDAMAAASAEVAAALPQAAFGTLANTRASAPPRALHRVVGGP